MEGQKNSPVQKVDRVIEHISDCIMVNDTSDRTPEMVKALAELIQARAYAEHLIGRSIE